MVQQCHGVFPGGGSVSTRGFSRRTTNRFTAPQLPHVITTCDDRLALVRTRLDIPGTMATSQRRQNRRLRFAEMRQVVRRDTRLSVVP